MRARACKCGGIVRAGVCSRCGPVVDERATSHERGYDYAWRIFSEQYRTLNPLCEDCLEQGKATPSQEVHHKRKLKERPELQYEPTNLLALCRRCHQARTARGE